MLMETGKLRPRTTCGIREVEQLAAKRGDVLKLAGDHDLVPGPVETDVVGAVVAVAAKAGAKLHVSVGRVLDHKDVAAAGRCQRHRRRHVYCSYHGWLTTVERGN